MPILTTLAGAVLGAMLGHGFEPTLAGGFIGLIAGLVINSWRRSRAPARAAGDASADAEDALRMLDARVAERLLAMERRIAALEATAVRVPGAAAFEASRAGASAAPVVEASPAGAAAMPAAEAAPATPGTPLETAPSGVPAAALAGAPAVAMTDAGAAVSTDAAEAAMTDASAAGRAAAVSRAPATAPGATAANAGAGRADAAISGGVPPMPAYGARRTAAAAAASAPPAPPAPPPVLREPGALWRFVSGGNTLARVGVVVLFIGVAFLLKYATEHVSIPITVRLAAVAVGAIVLLALGWRLRASRAGYAMSLQGAAIGILYLTVFAALRLYALVPPLAAFVLLFWIAALSSFLAIRQDTMALALIGIVGGFAAPVLTSSGGGSHVMLFSYYAVLNAAILGIAWFKAWRLLNVAGFVCTFIVGTLWGVTRYRPEDFATTEPFLVLFFLFYVGIATLYALRRSIAVRHYVDATLVFGTPLVAAGLQGALVRHIEYAMAWSALGMAAIYLLLARFLYTRHRDDLRLLVECFLALGVVFATLAVPLALDARLTSATWALEGAALVWVGARQDRRPARLFGLFLQLAAGVAFGLGFTLWTHRLAGGHLPVLNADCIGALLVALAGLASARVLSRAGAVTSTERALVPVAFGWGVLWWVGAGWREIERFVPLDARIAALVAFLAASALGFATASRRLDWPLARVPALLLAPALFAVAVFRVLDVLPAGSHVVAGWGFVAWPFALAIHVALLRHFERVSPPVAAALLEGGHAVLGWIVTLVVCDELAWLARTYTSGGAWRLVPWGLVPALVVIAICRGTSRPRWPLGTHVRGWLSIGATPLVVATLVWTLYTNVESTGNAAPLPFLPLLNPLDLTQGFVFVAIAVWFQRMRDVEASVTTTVSPQALGALAAGFLLFWVTFMTLRTLHHWADVPWSAAGMWASRTVQAALSIVWSVFALAAMVIAHRRRYRQAWVAGAALLAVVVAKLFLVDLSQVGGVERIVSFIGVGVLLLVIGYMAPVPPRREAP